MFLNAEITEIEAIILTFYMLQLRTAQMGSAYTELRRKLSLHHFAFFCKVYRVRFFRLIKYIYVPSTNAPVLWVDEGKSK